MNSPTTPPATADDEAIAAATRVLAEARNRCVGLGLTPQQVAELFLPEALLAFMVAGLRQEQVEEIFANFAREEIPAWFLQVKRTVGYCDCAREAQAEHAASCSSQAGIGAVTQHILSGSTREAGTD